MASAELLSLVESSSQLRNTHQLTLVQRPVDPLPVVNPLPPHVDDRFMFAATKVRKSAMIGVAPDRIRSESVAKLPHHQFVLGSNSRDVGRAPYLATA